LPLNSLGRLPACPRDRAGFLRLRSAYFSAYERGPPQSAGPIEYPCQPAPQRFAPLAYRLAVELLDAHRQHQNIDEQ
jgi:hypothetical protein